MRRKIAIQAFRKIFGGQKGEFIMKKWPKNAGEATSGA